MNALFELVQAWREGAEWERTARWALQQLEDLGVCVEGLVKWYDEQIAEREGRVELLRTSLSDANRAWSRAASNLRVVQADRASLIELNRALEREVDEVKADRDSLDRELGDLRRQLRDIRTAHEPLHKATFPASTTPGPYAEANYLTISSEQQDKIDRLYHAGYSCATGKARQEGERERDAVLLGYSGLR